MKNGLVYLVIAVVALGVIAAIVIHSRPVNVPEPSTTPAVEVKKPELLPTPPSPPPRPEPSPPPEAQAPPPPTPVPPPQPAAPAAPSEPEPAVPEPAVTEPAAPEPPSEPVEEESLGANPLVGTTWDYQKDNVKMTIVFVDDCTGTATSWNEAWPEKEDQVDFTYTFDQGRIEGTILAAEGLPERTVSLTLEDGKLVNGDTTMTQRK